MVKKVLVILSFSLFLTASSIPPVFADAGGSGATGGVGILTPSCFRSASGLIKVGGTAVFSTKDCSPADLIGFMNALNTFFYRLAIVLAVLMITIGGMQWLLAIGNSGKITQAKETIEQAVLGLILALTAILLFNQIDTRFTNLSIKTLSLTPAPEVPCDQRTTAAVCTMRSSQTCYWEVTDPEGSALVGKCKVLDCTRISKCEDYPPNKEICTSNNNDGFCKLKQLNTRCDMLPDPVRGYFFTDVCRTSGCQPMSPNCNNP